MFGDCLYREEECVVESNSYREHLNDYITYDINKYFNLNVDEYVHTTTYVKIALIEIAIERIKLFNSEEEEVKRKNRDILNSDLID